MRDIIHSLSEYELVRVNHYTERVDYVSRYDNDLRTHVLFVSGSELICNPENIFLFVPNKDENRFHRENVRFIEPVI